MSQNQDGSAVSDSDPDVRPDLADGDDEEETEEEHSHSLRRAATLTALVGTAHALLFLLAFWLLTKVPGAADSDAKIFDHYASAQGGRH
jgi:hypothetical protein